MSIYYSSNAAGWLDTCMESNCNIKPFFPWNVPSIIRIKMQKISKYCYATYVH